MPKRALSWNRAATLAMRDLRSAPAKFAFVLLSVAVGVAALVGVRGFSESFRHTLTLEARSLMAGDLTLRIFHPPSSTEDARLAAALPSGSRHTWTTETVSMISAPPDPVPILVTLKAVDPSEYPYYGHAELEPAQPLATALSADNLVVADELLVRLNTRVGQSLRLAGHSFRIAAVLRQEPDRMSSGAGLGPRVLISRKQLEALNLVSPGSRVTERMLVQIPPAADPVATRHALEAVLPEAQVTDYREGNPALTEGLDNATMILSLICLVAMVLGAIGVAMALHAHLAQRMEMLAILKALGAQTSDLIRIFLLQTLSLGLAGAVLGSLAGAAVMFVLPRVFGSLLPIHTHLSFPWHAAAAGLATGLLTTLLFSLPPLLDVRTVRPILVLRRLVEAGPANFRERLQRLAQRWPQLAISVVVLAALAAIAWALAGSAKVGTAFAVVFAVALIVLLALSAVLLAVLRFALNRTRLYLPSVLRHGLANLYRPGNQSAAVLSALGLGVLLILSVYLVQSTLLRQIRQTAAPNLPNIFLIDITPDEVAPLRSLLTHQPGVQPNFDLLAIVPARFRSINNQPVAELRDQHYPRHLLEHAEVSSSEQLPAGDRLVAGHWWTAPDASNIAIQQGVAERLHLAVGSSVVLEINDQPHPLTVAAIYAVDGQHIGARLSFLVPPALLADAPATWYAGLRVDSRQIPQLERALFSTLPTISVINLADVLDRIEQIVDQITFVIRFLAAFSIVSGLMILASSVASTSFRRMRESVVLKTLGATRLRQVVLYSIEFAVLGLLAGAVGAAFANLLTRQLILNAKLTFHFNPAATVVALLATALLAVATGWIASYRILGLRPLEVLRDE